MFQEDQQFEEHRLPQNAASGRGVELYRTCQGHSHAGNEVSYTNA